MNNCFRCNTTCREDAVHGLWCTYCDEARTPKVLIFGSLTWLLYGIAAGIVSDKDMANGFFAFGCNNSYVDPSGECDERTQVRGPLDEFAAHKKLMAALEAAERSGRVIWREPEDSTEESIEQFLAHLKAWSISIDACNWEYATPLLARIKRHILR